MFQLINGVGSKLAKLLTNKYGNPKSLEEAYDLLAKEELPKAAMQDILYRPLKIIPRQLIEYIDEDLHKLLNIKFLICGSYRRQLPYSSDIDIVIIGNIEDIVLDNNYNIIEPYASGQDRISCLLSINWMCAPLYVKIDFFTATEDNFAYMIYYATGSKEYNIRMRIKARKEGLLLNQYGLFTEDNELLPAHTEQEICSLLGTKYLEPNMRL